jgi:hypothetical protein
MRKITDIKALENYMLSCRFSDNEIKTIDLKPILDNEAFLPLKDEAAFKKVVNQSYFIDWLGLNIDLSADTLWHWGI